MYALFHSLDGENRYEWARGIILRKHPWIDKSRWGSEAKSGLKYKTRLNSIHCPSCRERIDSSQLVHELLDKDWNNYCNLCRPELKPAII